MARTTAASSAAPTAPSAMEPNQKLRRLVMMATVQMAMPTSSRVAAMVSQWWRRSCLALLTRSWSRSFSKLLRLFVRLSSSASAFFFDFS